jgi:hypothetical protein
VLSNLPATEALQLQRPLADGALRIIATGTVEDWSPERALDQSMDVRFVPLGDIATPYTTDSQVHLNIST